MKAQDHLAKYGITVDQAFDYILQNLNNPAGLFSTLKAAALSTEMVAQIVQTRVASVTSEHVRQFFRQYQLDSSELDLAYFNHLRSTLSQYTAGTTNDKIVGTAGDDYIDGGAGADTIDGGDGDDQLIGGSGNDLIKGGWGSDYIEGGLGSDVLEGGQHSTGYYDNKNYKWVDVYDTSPNYLYGGGGDDELSGGYGADLLDGGDGMDQLYGHEGNDLLKGGAGDDTIEGGLGSDTIWGGSGNDKIYSYSYSYWGWTDEDDADTISAEDGDDYINVGGDDDVDAGNGADTTIVSSSGRELRSGVIKPSEGADRVEAYDLLKNTSIIIDLAETEQSQDIIVYNISSNRSMTTPGMIIKSFDPAYDRIDIGQFNLVDGIDSWGFYSYHYEAGYYSYTAQGKRLDRSYVQILSSPTEPYKTQSKAPQGPDDWGKGIFVVRNARAASDDIQDVAPFLDAYGNNHQYNKNVAHYFLVNVSPNDMALYKFNDDSGADNTVTPDELTPIARLVGLTTEQISVDQFISMLI